MASDRRSSCLSPRFSIAIAMFLGLLRQGHVRIGRRAKVSEVSLVKGQSYEGLAERLAERLACLLHFQSQSRCYWGFCSRGRRASGTVSKYDETRIIHWMGCPRYHNTHTRFGTRLRL